MTVGQRWNLTAANADAAYTALHEGRPPDRTTYDDVPLPMRRAQRYVRMTAIEYSKKVPGSTPNYRHPFADGAQPCVAIDEHGRLRVARGKYVVTDAGIEDLPPRQQRPERFPRGFNRTIELGRLRYVQYTYSKADGSEVSGVWDFTHRSGPTVVRDEAGHLHFIGGHYTIDPTGEHTMARRRRRAARTNPTSSKGMVTQLQKVLVGSAVTGSVVAMTFVGMQKALATNTMPPYAKAGVKAGVGVALAYGLSMVPAIPDTIAAGVGIGGVASGLLDAYETFMRQRAAAAAEAARRAAAPPTPAGYAGLGAGMPAGGVPNYYTTMNQEACAVR